MQLVIVDTAQIQPYVFGSNRLRENIGASHLVAAATGEWALQAVREAAPRHNIKPDLTLDDSRRIEDAAGLDAEVLYTGGGNCTVLFREKEAARAFTRELSQCALREAPGLQLVISREEFGGGQSLAEAVDGLFVELARQKQERSASAPLLGLGVTRKCASTELPAVGMTPRIGRDPYSAYPASPEILAKLAVGRSGSREAERRLRGEVPPPEKYDYPGEFDEMGRSYGERSYIAVVHADGDGMGTRIRAIGQTYRRADQNREYVHHLRDFSRAVQQAAKGALTETLDLLGRRLDEWSSRAPTAGTRDPTRPRLAKANDGRLYLPFRPVVFGGDDVTFVCDGRLGLGLALAYLRRFEQRTANLPDGAGPATACAGVAVVKVHYPFARAYTLAEELCRSAKKLRRTLAGDGWRGSCLDWHFAVSGLAGDLDDIRSREYEVGAGRLSLRPVTLGENPGHPFQAWDVVKRGALAFNGPGWAGRRNKVKALRETLREGPGAVNQFLFQFNEGRPLPDVEPSLTDWPTKGWQQGRCGYFDAIELADWFIPVDEEDAS